MFTKPQAIFFIKRNSIELYDGKSQSFLEKLDFGPQIVSSEEVLDPEGLARLLGDFFPKVTFPGQKAFLVLSDELTFSKVIDGEKAKQEELENDKKQFLDSVPLDARELLPLDFFYKNKRYLAACNKKLLEGITGSLSKLGRVVEFAVPALVFGVVAGALTAEDIKGILSNKQLIKLSNLHVPSKVVEAESLGPGEPVPAERGAEAGAFDTKYFFIPAFVVIAIMVLVGGAIFLSGSGAVDFKLSKFNPFAKGDLKSQPSPSPASSVSPDAGQKLSDKGQISVNVINGTGTAGQAGKVKTMLESLGFSDITTANSENPTSIVTMLEFAGDVASEVKREVENELSLTFETVKTGDLPADSSYKIVITTGLEK